MTKSGLEAAIRTAIQELSDDLRRCHEELCGTLDGVSEGRFGALTRQIDDMNREGGALLAFAFRPSSMRGARP